jgi:UDP-glucose 4-epimerase
VLYAVEKHLGMGKVNVVYGERRAGDPARLVAGTVVSSSTLGWRAEHSDLETIINSAWKWYNNPPESVDNESK